jgi:predicted RNA-binding Zn ribbon-like protein
VETFEKAAAAERPAHIRELPIVTGHLALDFANTVDDPDGPNRFDHIGTYAGLLHWAVRVGILAAAKAQKLFETGPPSLRAAHVLRGVLIEMFGGIAAGQPAADEYWAGLRPFVTDSYRHSDLVPQGRSYVMRWPDDRPDAVLWPVARAAADLLTAPELGRLKRCAGCPWVFLDRSRNGSRRWCSMEDCGTHAKIHRYVTKRKASKTRKN